MGSFKEKITIKFNWWTDDEEVIDSKHREMLIVSAWESITKMLGDGYIEGKLSDYVHIHDSDPEDGIEYNGWWKFKIKSCEGG